MDGVLDPLAGQWQLALFVLCVVMAALVWRAHRQVGTLGRTARAMQEQLGVLTDTVNVIKNAATITEHAVVQNLIEYRMALGSTTGYRGYLQKLGAAPAADVEPLLESVPGGATAVGKDGRILYMSEAQRSLTGCRAGMTIREMAEQIDVRTLSGDGLDPDDLPMSRILRGAEVRDEYLRIRPVGASEELVLSVSGSPVRDGFGQVVAAVVVAREVPEHVALAQQWARAVGEPSDQTVSLVSGLT